MNQDYVLFKKLKDAGFPQKGKGTLIPSPDCLGGKTCKNCFVYIPILEELVEACGEHIAWLHQSDPKKKTWAAQDWIYDDDKGHFGSGATPSAAVANLWLALNKKS